jgi:RND family efflux transporter MFP subunit
MKYDMCAGAVIVALVLLGCQNGSEMAAPHAGTAKASAETGPEGHDHEAHGGEEEPAGHEGHGHESQAEAEGHEGHDHGAEEAGHEGHDHSGHEHAELPLDELAEKRCEHDMATIACGECRYELGVVEVPPDVAGSLLTEVAARPMLKTFRELNLRCETATDQQRAVEVVAMVGGRVEAVGKSLGQAVKKGDVLAVLASDEFSEIKLAHQNTHQALELAQSRFERLVRVQGNLEQLLGRLRSVAAEGIDVEAISKLEIGGAKAELMAAANGYLRARSDWERDAQRVLDGGKLIAHVTGKAQHDVDTLALGNWKAEVLAARAELRLAHRTMDRLEALSAKNLASRKELDEARHQLSVARIRFDAAVEQVGFEISTHEAAALERLNTGRSRLESAIEEAVLTLEVARMEAQQELDRASTMVAVSHRRLGLFGFSEAEIETLLDRESDHFATLEVRAPTAGTIINQSLSLGQMVAQGQPLYQVADLNTLWTWCHVYEKDLAPLALSTLPLPAKVHSDAFTGRVFTGSLDYLDRVTDEHSRTVRARVVTQNPAGLLRPNMFVQAAVDVPTDGAGVLSVPASAVVSDDGTDFVFVHWREHLWVKRTVTVARRNEATVLLSAGLSPGDKVAATGAFFLKSDVLREKMGEGCAH